MKKSKVESLVSFPSTDKEKEEAYQKTVDVVGGEDYVYDPDILTEIKNYDDYSDEAKQELKLWAALGYLTPRMSEKGELQQSGWMIALNKSEKPLSLKALEQIRALTNTLVTNARIAAVNDEEPTDASLSDRSEVSLYSYLSNINELKPKDLREIIAYNYYTVEKSVASKSASQGEGMPEAPEEIDSQLLTLPSNGDERRKLISKLNDFLLIIAYDNIAVPLYNNQVDINQFPKSALDVIILGLANGVDVLKIRAEQLTALGITDVSKVEFPAADKLQNIIDTYMKSNDITPEYSSITEVVSKLLATFDNDTGLFSVAHASDLRLITPDEQEEEKKQAEEVAEQQDEMEKSVEASAETPVVSDFGTNEEVPAESATGEDLMDWAKNGFSSKQDLINELHNISELSSALQDRVALFEEALNRTKF